MAWLWWVGIALALGVIEMLTVDLTFLMLGGGALAAAAAAALGAPFWVQMLVFALAAALLLFAVRPWAKNRLTSSTPESRTNVDALIGATGVVVAPVDRQAGRVRLEGAEWSARLDPNVLTAPLLQNGASVRVVEIDGAVAVVVPEPA